MKHRLVIIGTGRTDHDHVHKDLHSRLTSAGIDVTQRYHYPRVTLRDARASLDGDDLVVKESGWIRDVPNSLVESVIESAEDSTALIWGESAITRADLGELVGFIDKLPKMPRSEATVLPPDMADKHNIPDVEFADDDSVKNKHAPFSYDPAKDYYTEPERY